MPARTPIPRLTKTGNGFGGFAVNPSIPYSGGRVLTSDVEDAANSLNFGGTPAPRPTPSPSPTSSFNDSGPTVDLGFGERPIFHWPYDGPNKNGYMVESGIDIYPGDNDPTATAGPRSDGLPTDPGGLNEGPGLFPAQDQPDMVTLYKGAPGDHGIPVWWDANNHGTNRAGPQPWWVTFNPNIGNNLFTSAIDLGIGTRPPPSGAVSGGPQPALLPGEAWVDINDYPSNNVVPAADRTDPGFVDPGSGLEPDPSITTSTTSTRNKTNTGSGTTGGSITAPVGTHWDFTRGTYVQNDFAGGPQHNNPISSHADDLMTMWDQSRFQPTNRQVAPDSGRDTFAPGSAGVLDPETGILRGVQSPQGFAFSMSQKPGAPVLRLGDPKSTAAYNAWVMQQPEYKAFMQRMLGAGATPSFQTGGTPRSGSGGG